VRDGRRLPASYANFYIANKVVLLPVFADQSDRWAVAVLEAAFPRAKSCRSTAANSFGDWAPFTVSRSSSPASERRSRGLAFAGFGGILRGHACSSRFRVFVPPHWPCRRDGTGTRVLLLTPSLAAQSLVAEPGRVSKGVARIALSLDRRPLATRRAQRSRA
jgi:hypothetical protein